MSIEQNRARMSCFLVLGKEGLKPATGGLGLLKVLAVQGVQEVVADIDAQSSNINVNNIHWLLYNSATLPTGETAHINAPLLQVLV